ncbi:MAG: hypothetical protein IJ157_04805 [Clostridia bacterium]|nr:hypothetical protein [Clostridia bacterium]
MEILNDIYEAKELLGENLHDLIQHVKQNCNGDLLEHDAELCTMKMLLSGMAKACEIAAMEERESENEYRRSYAEGGSMRGNPGRAYEGGGSGAQRRSVRTGRFMRAYDGGQDMRQEWQEKINNIPDMQTRMDMQRMLDALSGAMKNA